MADPADPEDLKLLIRVLRGLRGWDQSTLAEAAGMDPSSVSHYETGRTVPPRKSVEALAAAVGVTMSYVEGALLPALAAGRVAATPFSEAEPEAADLDQALAGAVRSRVETFLEMLDAARSRPWERSGPLTPEDRSLATGLWERLEPRTAEERLFLVESCREFQLWSLAERLCRESEEALPARPDQALELARLAHRVAELAPGEPAWRSLLEGYALSHLASAQRAAGDLAAEATFARAWQLWEAGTAGDPGWLGKGS
jgi:transcriptional regulator with XRE-family HTH domain